MLNNAEAPSTRRIRGIDRSPVMGSTLPVRRDGASVQVHEQAGLITLAWRERVCKVLITGGLDRELRRAGRRCVQVFKERTRVIAKTTRPGMAGMQTSHGGERTGQPPLDSQTTKRILSLPKPIVKNK
jgi:hypothetical protein